MTVRPLDLAGIGIGPFNLSLAAQLDGIEGVAATFFDRRAAFDWHPGMMLPDAAMQTSFLKDLVTATNPTSPWSFIAYLVAHKRFYEFLNAGFDAIPRKEFANYLSWVAAQLDSVRFGAPVHEVDVGGDAFRLTVGDGETVRAHNIALGFGLEPNVPSCARHALGPRCFHASHAAFELGRQVGRSVAIVGGGQSGAEILLHLLSLGTRMPRRIAWISRRENFQPLEETPFTDELFTPQYVEHFHALPEARRRAIVQRHTLAGSGISPATLSALYRRLYALRHLEQAPVDVELLPSRSLIELTGEGSHYRLVLRNGFDGGIDMTAADQIVLATGYGFVIPEALAPLRRRIALDDRGRFIVGADFSIAWDGPPSQRIFALNAGLHSHGIAEPQLSLMAWRSAVIVNALLGRAHFDLDLPEPPVMWRSRADVRRSAEL